MSDRDEAKRLRVRDGAIACDLSISPYATDPGPPCLVALTTQLTAYPNTPQSFFACVPIAVLGTEVEGDQATLSPLPSTFFALNLGGSVPPQGTYVIVSFVGNRWVFRYDG